ncbi:MAG: MBL fold metallo-hydrolase [Gemmatimonadales bacterium]
MLARPLLRSSPLLLAFAALAGPVEAQQQDFSAVQIRTVPVAPGLYVLVGSGGNIGLSVGEDGSFIVDDQFAPLSEKIRAAIRAVSDKPVKFVLNTHWHGDHTGGNEPFGVGGAIIVAHDNVRRRMNPAEFKDVMGRTQQAPRAALPVVTFGDAVTFHWNGETMKVVHVPAAHTDGDVIIHYQQADAVHMGDTFFNGRYPFVDTESGGSIQGVIGAANTVLGMVKPSTKIIPGHGDIAGPAELTAYRDMLVTVRDRVQALIGRGMSADQVVAAKPTEDLDAKWGANAERFVRAVYQGLSGK